MLISERTIRFARLRSRPWSGLLRSRIFVLAHGPFEFRWRSSSASRRRALTGAALLALACIGRVLRAEEGSATCPSGPECHFYFRLLHRGFPAGDPSSGDGARLLLRASPDGARSYEVAVNRRDNTVSIRKNAQGSYLLTQELPHATPYDRWQALRVSIRDLQDGSVTIELASGRSRLAAAVDDGSIGGAPIREPGRTVLLRERALIEVADFEARGSERPELAAAPPEPAIASITPSRAPAGDSAIDLAIDGSGFSPESSVRWNGSVRPAFLQGAHRLIIRLSQKDLAVPGDIPVTVSNPGANTSNALAFRVAPGILNAEVSKR